MKIKTVDILKIDVKKLSGEDLELLQKFGKSREFEMLNELASEAMTRRAFEALEAKSLEEIGILNGYNVGVRFVLDTVKRAVEELKDRGVDIDNEEDIK